jgi:hypothetical protein
MSVGAAPFGSGAGLSVRSFTVTAAGQKVNLDATGSAQTPFTVTNTSAQPIRGRLLTKPNAPAKPEWLSVVGESMRDFGPNAAEQVVVQLNVPPTTAPPGSYAFRLDAVSEVDPDEDFTEGPSVAFEVAPPPPKPKKKFPWWILIVVGAVVLAIVTGVVVFLLVRGSNGDPAKQLAGEWRNIDPNTRSTTHYVFAKSGDGLNIYGYGACSPTDCDWATAPGVGGPRTVPLADVSDRKFQIVWHFGFKTQVDDMALAEDGQRLTVASTHTYASGGQRTETQVFQKAR